MESSQLPPSDATGMPSQPNPAPPFLRPPPLPGPPRYGPPPRKGRGWKIVSLVLGLLLVFSLLGNVQHWAFSLIRVAAPTRTSGPRLEETFIEDNDSTNKIVVISVEGIITSQAFDRTGYDMVKLIREQLKRAEREDEVKAVLLKVNSPGGEVLASDEINRALADFQQKSGKPVVAAMDGLAASGGYYVSVPCRWIVANELTITGSIGVIMHAYNYRGLMDKIGLRPEVYKSGKFKDMLSGDKKESEITQEERDMVQKLIDDTFAKFKSVVADGRDQARKKNRDNKESKGRGLSPNWTEYADGRVLSGKEAYELGFVDELGNFEIAVKRARKLATIDRASLVEYQPIFDFSSFLRLFGKSDARTLKVDLGLDLPKLQAGQPYFLSPTYVH